ncbi:MAG: hypothetical protein EOO48_00700 [Flavobacterium sp.]|nr:MAG: hypothetical protein EOO48_00700 [Flavobacterium sp.]
MKTNLLFAFICAISLSACTSEPAPLKNSVVTARIDGRDVVFNTVNVNQRTYNENGYVYTDVRVTASVDRNPDERISFVVEKNVTGANSEWYFAYWLYETAFPKMPGLEMMVDKNDHNELLGTFSGQVQADIEPHDVVDIENGTFEVYY